MTESARVLQLRQELAELGDPEPGTADLAAATRASILAELSDLGAPAVPPAEAPRPIHPAVRLQVHMPAPRPFPSNPFPAAAAAAEKPMPRAPETPSPRLTTLLERLKSNLAAKKNKAAGITRMAIRRHCMLHGLPVPPEAAIQATPARRSSARPPPQPRQPRPMEARLPDGRRPRGPQPRGRAAPPNLRPRERVSPPRPLPPPLWTSRT